MPTKKEGDCDTHQQLDVEILPPRVILCIRKSCRKALDILILAEGSRGIMRKRST